MRPTATGRRSPVVSTRTFNWRPKWDPRSTAFTATAMCSSLAERKSVMHTKDIWLDQGSEGACTGFGEEHVQALTPYSRETANWIAQDIYHQARREDEWPGEDYEGSSVNGAMKAARLAGRVKSWIWATTLPEARHGLSYHGAGEAGTWWWEGMDHPDSEGFIYPTGSKRGGHAYAIAGYRTGPQGRAFRMENSWGQGWGDNGGAWILEQDFAILMSDQGELTFPTKVRV